MKKTIILLLIPLLILAGCAGEGPAPEETTATEASTTWLSPPDKQPSSLFGVAFCPSGSVYNPITDSSSVNRGYAALVFDGLFRLDGSFAPQSMLCESIDIAGKTVTLTLRQGVLFHDGTPFTAADAAYSLTLARDSERSPYAGRLSCVSGIKQEGDYTLVLTLTREKGAIACLLDVPMIKKGSGSTSDAVGCGRYEPVISDDVSYLTVNTSYYLGAGGGDMDYMMISRVDDADSLVYAFAAGTVDIVLDERVSSRDEGFLADCDRYEVDTGDLHFVMFNAKKLNAGLRLALSRAIDRAAVFDSGVAAQSALFPAATGLSDEAETAAICGFDADAAAELMRAQGYSMTGGSWRDASGEPLTLTLLVCAGVPARAAAAERIAAMLTAFGAETRVETLSSSECQKRLKNGSFDLALCETRVSADFDFTFLLGSGGSANYGGFADAELDGMLTAFAAAKYGSAYLLSEKLSRAAAELSPIAVIGYETAGVLITRGYRITGVSATASDIFYSISEWKEGK